jgi:cyclohexadieny/prephenate dehydrogenase
MICDRLAIIGPGLLGASIAKAVRARLPGTRISVWARREAAVQELLGDGAADAASTELAEVVSDADLVVLCVPIGAMRDLAAGMAGNLKPGCIVTDVGSVKAAVCESLAPLFTHPTEFVGSHPMAGSEESGAAYSDPDLFRDSLCILTPTGANTPKAIQQVTQFWELLGSRVTQMSPDAHDAAVGFVSHLPHLLAATLLNAIQSGDPAAFDVCGNGLRDSTRIAAGPAPMWAGILRANENNVRRGIEAMIEKLREAERILHNEAELESFLATARDIRRRLKNKTSCPTGESAAHH